jgi:hypothetical protein
MKGYNPKYAKDHERSTWWMEDKTMNYKMEKWTNRIIAADISPE